MTISSSSPASRFQLPVSPYRIIGIGNAGVNFLDRLLLASPSFSGLVALNNDTESLAASVVPSQILLPTDLEFSPTFSSENLATLVPRLAEEIEQTSLVILLGGLGGGFTSALLPHVAAMSKAAKKVTLACVSLPFSFEGKRTQSIAAASLAALEKECDGILLLDNDRLCSTRASRVALGETFSASDEAMEASLPALLAILFNKGPVRITRPNFLKALQRPHSKSCVGYGQATGTNRLHEALESALKSPLLDRGRSLAKASDIFLLLRGPKNISFAEVQVAMQELERLAGVDHDIQLSVHAYEEEGAPLKVFLLAIVGENMNATAKAESLILKKEVSSTTPCTSLEVPPLSTNFSLHSSGTTNKSFVSEQVPSRALNSKEEEEVKLTSEKLNASIQILHADGDQEAAKPYRARQESSLKQESRSPYSSSQHVSPMRHPPDFPASAGDRHEISRLASKFNHREAIESSIPYSSPVAATVETGSKVAVSMMKHSPREEEKKFNQNIKGASPETVDKNLGEPHNPPATKSSVSPKNKATQGALNLKSVQRGRFDKSEPTIVEGEDLDTPTYLRLGLKLS